ncbi:TPA: hypothetical protein L5P36_002336 [Pseudomonas aeruginosa]|uniref:hypothetical protein n=1 Tax=Pseudomonas aeruginosa TaxID=287 RepID=UPI0024121A29|nr:hypothetical protein [Pseudomonas aeruginosa]HBP0041568.1 hypothetical protein [Pseudomonas aeruginosa]
MSIDWSKAPEGATHYQPESRGFHAAWFRLQGGKAREMWVVIPGGALEHIIDPTVFDESMQNLIARPAEPATWNGKGLPPVGTVCEYRHMIWPEYRPCEIRYISEESLVAYDDAQEQLYRTCDMLFRPIRTPDQIAAEEREKAVGDMAMSIQGVPYQYPTLYALYDAGYRRQEEGK